MRFWKPKPIPEGVSVGIGATAYLGHPRRAAACRCFLASLQAQTFPSWQVIVRHDGPWPQELKPKTSDPRIRLDNTPQRHGGYGHALRQSLLDELTPKHRWVVLTNEDNYYVPTFLEWMIAEGESRDAWLVCCNLVHSHRFWQPLPVRMRRGQIDLGCALVRSTLAQEVPFARTDFAADAGWLTRLAERAGSKVVFVDAFLMVHN